MDLQQIVILSFSVVFGLMGKVFGLSRQEDLRWLGIIALVGALATCFALALVPGAVNVLLAFTSSFTGLAWSRWLYQRPCHHLGFFVYLLQAASFAFTVMATGFVFAIGILLVAGLQWEEITKDKVIFMLFAVCCMFVALAMTQAPWPDSPQRRDRRSF